MVSTIWKSPIFTPPRRWAQCGAIDIDSWPPATMMSASPLAICCIPRDGAQPRTAKLVECPGSLLGRDAGRHGGLTGRVLTRVGGQHLAENYLVDFARIDPGAL